MTQMLRRRVVVRVDDVTSPIEPLRGLVRWAAEHAVPLSLAVIPARMAPQLPLFLRSCFAYEITQHGWSHTNHEPPTSSKCEFGDSVSVGASLSRIAIGVSLLRATFPHSFAEVFVPPWNRCSQSVIEGLPEIGLRAISRSWVPPDRRVPGLTERPVTIDLDHCRSVEDAELFARRSDARDKANGDRTGTDVLMVHPQNLSPLRVSLLTSIVASYEQAELFANLT